MSSISDSTFLFDIATRQLKPEDPISAIQHHAASGAPMSPQNTIGETPLHTAAKCANNTVVRALVNQSKIKERL